MSLKKFISGVSAFAVAVTAFAAMAVTASAETKHTETILPSDAVWTSVNMENIGNGTFKANSTGAAGISAYLGDLPDIGKASEIEVSFDTKILGNSSAIMQAMFGVGDFDQRGLNLGGSTSSYKYSPGLVSFFGATGTTKYQVASEDKTDSTNYAQYAVNNTVHVDVKLNRDTKAYSVVYTIIEKNLSTTQTGVTDLDDLYVIEAYIKGSTAAFTLNNIKVSYTVPDAPPTYITSEIEAADNVGDDGVYARAFTTDITFNGIAIQNVKVDVEGSNEGSQTISFGGYSGDVSIGIILASKDSSKIANVTPTVTVNAD